MNVNNFVYESVKLFSAKSNKNPTQRFVQNLNSIRPILDAVLGLFQHGLVRLGTPLF